MGALPADFTGLMVGTPCYGGMTTAGYFQSVLHLALGCQMQQIPFEIAFMPNDSLVSRARNSLAAVFLTSGCSHLLFVDADIEFNPPDALRLLAADKELICGVYPMKTIELRFPFNLLPESLERLNRDPATGAIEIRSAPGGFMMIHRRVFEAMMAAWPELGYRDLNSPLDLFDFFECVRNDGALLSEDFAFCHKWRQLGGQVWALFDIQLVHHGAHAYTGCPAQFLGSVPAAA